MKQALIRKPNFIIKVYKGIVLSESEANLIIKRSIIIDKMFKKVDRISRNGELIKPGDFK